MIDMEPITPWGIFNMLYTGTVVAEFNNVILKASGKTFEFIQADFNEKIWLADENSDEVKSWKEKTKIGSWRVKVTQ